jgi:hypothetical protein
MIAMETWPISFRAQDFNQQAQKASAAHRSHQQFNTQNMQDVQHRNIASQNAAMAR